MNFLQAARQNGEPHEDTVLLPHRKIGGRFTSKSCHVWTAPAVQEKNLAFLRIVRVQPCIRPLNAAVLAAGADVIR